MQLKTSHTNPVSRRKLLKTALLGAVALPLSGCSSAIEQDKLSQNYRNASLNSVYDDKFLEIIRYGSFAFSLYNLQPWRFSFNYNRISIKADKITQLKYADPNNHMQYIALGACLSNMLIAGFEAGYSPSVYPDFENRDEVEVTFIRTSSLSSPPLFNQLSLAEQTTDNFDPFKVDENFKNILEESEQNQARLVFAESPETINNLANIESDCLKSKLKNSGFVDEILSNMRYNNSQLFAQKNGIPFDEISLFSNNKYLGKLGALAVVNPYVLPLLQKSQINSSSIIIGLYSLTDNKNSWFEVGQSLQKIILRATQRGLGYRVFHLGSNTSEYAKKIKEELDLKGLYPQVLLCLGKTDQKRILPRIPAHTLLI